MTNHNYTLAKKYARAFTNVYKDIINKQNIEPLKNFASFCIDHVNAPFYSQLIDSSNTIVSKKYGEVVKQFKIDDSVNKLIELLISHKRLALLPDVILSIVAIIKDRLEIEEFKIVSSSELDELQLKNIENTLSNKIKKNIVYNTKIDKNLIAGIKVYSDNYGFVHSVAAKLKALAMAMHLPQNRQTS